MQSKILSGRRAKKSISAKPRIAIGKELKSLREQGWLPVHLYGDGFESQALQVKIADFEKVFGETEETDSVDLKIGNDIKVINIRNLHLHPESRMPLHVDFYQTDSKQGVNYSSFGRPLLRIGFSTLFLILLFFLTQKATTPATQHPPATKQVLAHVAEKGAITTPLRLKIPGINVDAIIERVGLTSDGAMEVPSNSVNVGLFALGPRPGEKGNAVIAGHFDGEKGEVGVFSRLNKLKKGDKLHVEDSNGRSLTFVVREKRMYDPGYADEVFSENDGTHLNLITCDGVWDGIKKSYSKRLVVFTDAL